MTVPAPLTDEMFAVPDEQLAQAVDLPHGDLVAEAMCIYSCDYDTAEARVLNNPTKTKAEIARFWQ